MDYISIIKAPIKAELEVFTSLFRDSLSHTDGMLQQALNQILNRKGKQMRPILILLIAKNFGEISMVTHNAAIGLELLHTASLIHDDVVDESRMRRGQASVNATFDNKVAVLVGDYILSTALLHISKTERTDIIEHLAKLGQRLSNGEILQLSNISSKEFSEDVYFQVIKGKTAALFETCATMGAMSVEGSDEMISKASVFGQQLGIIFQLKDDIFDYSDSKEIGKPTGNDMIEGKLTLPVIHALNVNPDPAMIELARKVKSLSISQKEIETLVRFTIDNGGIEYSERKMWEIHSSALSFIEKCVEKPDIQDALRSYLDFMIMRSN